jgi:hypothetical protein
VALPEIEIYFELTCEKSKSDNIINLLSSYPSVKSVIREELTNDTRSSTDKENLVCTAAVRFRSQVDELQVFLKNIEGTSLRKFLPESPKFFTSALKRISISTGLIVGLAVLAHHIIVFFEELKLGHLDFNILIIDIATAIFAGFVAFILEIIATFRERG